MMETNFVTAEKAGGKHRGFERKDGAHRLFVQKDAAPASCFCLDRWENEGGAVTKKTTSITR